METDDEAETSNGVRNRRGSGMKQAPPEPVPDLQPSNDSAAIDILEFTFDTTDEDDETEVSEYDGDDVVDLSDCSTTPEDRMQCSRLSESDSSPDVCAKNKGKAKKKLVYCKGGNTNDYAFSDYNMAGVEFTDHERKRKPNSIRIDLTGTSRASSACSRSPVDVRQRGKHANHDTKKAKIAGKGKKVCPRRVRRGASGKARFDDEFRYPNYRCNFQTAIRTLKRWNFQPYHIFHLKRIPFWYLIDAALTMDMEEFKRYAKCDAQIASIVRRFETRSITGERGFAFGKELFCPVRDHMEVVMGIRDGEWPIHLSSSNVRDFPFITRCWPNNRAPFLLNKKMITDKLDELLLLDPTKDDVLEDIARLVHLFLLSILFTPNQNNNVPFQVFRYVENLNDICYYDWSTFVLDYLLDGIEKARTVKVVGCTVFLLFWLCEVCPLIGAREGVKHFPRFRKWSLSALKAKMQETDLNKIQHSPGIHLSLLEMSRREKKYLDSAEPMEITIPKPTRDRGQPQFANPEAIPAEHMVSSGMRPNANVPSESALPGNDLGGGNNIASSSNSFQSLMNVPQCNASDGTGSDFMSSYLDSGDDVQQYVLWEKLWDEAAKKQRMQPDGGGRNTDDGSAGSEGVIDIHQPNENLQTVAGPNHQFLQAIQERDNELRVVQHNVSVLNNTIVQLQAQMLAKDQIILSREREMASFKTEAEGKIANLQAELHKAIRDLYEAGSDRMELFRKYELQTEATRQAEDMVATLQKNCLRRKKASYL